MRFHAETLPNGHIRIFDRAAKMTATDYLDQRIGMDEHGRPLTLGAAYLGAMRAAQSRGHHDPKGCADRWLQGWERTHAP